MVHDPRDVGLTARLVHDPGVLVHQRQNIKRVFRFEVLNIYKHFHNELPIKHGPQHCVCAAARFFFFCSPPFGPSKLQRLGSPGWFTTPGVLVPRPQGCWSRRRRQFLLNHRHLCHPHHDHSLHRPYHCQTPAHHDHARHPVHPARPSHSGLCFFR